MRLHFPSLLLFLFLSRLAFGAMASVSCPAGVPIGNVDLRVLAPDQKNPLPLRTINRLEEGDTIVYSPILGTNQKRSGDVSLVLVPVVPESKDQHLIVLEPKPAGKAEKWKVPRKISVVAFVYGADGLSRGKVKDFLAKDEDLVTQLADYAEKTAQTEDLIQALSSGDSSSANVDAALQGFASQYGLSTKIDRTQPANQQAMTLLQTLNPALATYDPLASASSQRLSQTASLATSVAGLFFGSPVGLAAGGTAMLIDLKSLAFPKSDFRSSFAEKLPNDGLGLCGSRTPAPPHTKVAYLWATRVPNIGPPQITAGSASSIPVTQKSPVPVEAPDSQWKYVDRVRNWELVNDSGKAFPIKVTKLVNPKSLELDLSKVTLNPGKYHLRADWDWDPFTVTGNIDVQPLGNFGSARPSPQSQDRLIAGAGKVKVTLEGSDFEFVTGVQFEKAEDEFAKPAPVPFILPSGLRRGPQKQMDLLVETQDLNPGAYKFLVSQVDGRAHPVPVQILPVPPQIDNLPILISQNERSRMFTLKGQHLDLLTKLQTSKGTIALGPAQPNQTERSATLRVDTDLKAASTYDVKAFIYQHNDPVTLPNAIHVVGPRPVIEGAKLSAPPDMGVALQPGELPAGLFISSLLHVRNLSANSAIQVRCQGQENNTATLHLGDHSSSASLQQLAPDQLFLSFDTSGRPGGCVLQVAVDNGPDGESAPCELGRLLRVPKIDTFQLINNQPAAPASATSSSAVPGEESGATAPEPAQQASDPAIPPTGAMPQTGQPAAPAAPTENGRYAATLTGTDLQNIAQVGWDATNGTAVVDLPAPIPGQGLKQSLHVTLPAPVPAEHAPLYIWLRGDTTGRLTNIHD
ncbi:MAG TPA: hypothetical protein VN737_20510 [Bryobacteraceae bacterium]|nr:hypothetical protein [Bryobacteraceae bacterium]